jgi:hypothetical protein
MVVEGGGLTWTVELAGYRIWREPGTTDRLFDMVIPARLGEWMDRGHAPRGAVSEADERGSPPPPPGPAKTYEPMKIPDIFHRLAETPMTEAGIVGFANRFGLLGQHAGRSVDDYLVWDNFSFWRREISSLSLALRCWKALRDRDHAAFGGLVEELGKRYVFSPPVSSWSTIDAGLHGLVSEGLQSRVSGMLQRRQDGVGSALVFRTDTLIGAIWLQFGQVIAQGNWRDCAYCRVPFQPKKSSARYCSESHRQRAYQQRREKGGAA